MKSRNVMMGWEKRDWKVGSESGRGRGRGEDVEPVQTVRVEQVRCDSPLLERS